MYRYIYPFWFYIVPPLFWVMLRISSVDKMGCPLSHLISTISNKLFPHIKLKLLSVRLCGIISTQKQEFAQTSACVFSSCFHFSNSQASPYRVIYIKPPLLDVTGNLGYFQGEFWVHAGQKPFPAWVNSIYKYTHLNKLYK